MDLGVGLYGLSILFDQSCLDSTARNALVGVYIEATSKVCELEDGIEQTVFILGLRRIPFAMSVRKGISSSGNRQEDVRGVY